MTTKHEDPKKMEFDQKSFERDVEFTARSLFETRMEIYMKHGNPFMPIVIDAAKNCVYMSKVFHETLRDSGGNYYMREVRS